MNYKLHHGDNLTFLRGMPDNSVDSIVTDPPYGLAFMGKAWDYDIPAVELWKECLRVLKPGGHLLSFAGARTHHRMASCIEDAGFEIRDMVTFLFDTNEAFRQLVGSLNPSQLKLMAQAFSGDGLLGWIYGSGFPKSSPVAKNISDLLDSGEFLDSSRTGTVGTGLGSALKPALEPITMARKPFKGSLARNVLTNGTGALNIDACRIPFAGAADEHESKAKNRHAAFGTDTPVTQNAYGEFQRLQQDYGAPGRWPANVMHDGSSAVLARFPQSSTTGKRTEKSRNAAVAGTEWLSANHASTEYTDSGSTSRFFYCAKANPKDRHEGLENPGPQFSHGSTPRQHENGAAAKKGNHHPTVKPTSLMMELCRLVTPQGGVVLDPFMGSGSTGKACAIEGFSFIGIERELEYVNIARARISFILDKLGLRYAIE